MLMRLILAGLLLALPAAAQEVGDVIKGKATVVDGDTVKIDGKSIRIFGIDIPERGEPGFKRASDLMRAATERGPFNCSVVDIDRYKRHVAQCIIDAGDELRDAGQAMLEAGFAKVYTRYRHLWPLLIGWYERVEAKAKGECVGLWAADPECR